MQARAALEIKSQIEEYQGMKSSYDEVAKDVWRKCRTYKCGKCGEIGHNRRTCQSWASAPPPPRCHRSHYVFQQAFWR